MPGGADSPAAGFDVVVGNNNPRPELPPGLRLPVNAWLVWEARPGSYAARNARWRRGWRGAVLHRFRLPAGAGLDRGRAGRARRGSAEPTGWAGDRDHALRPRLDRSRAIRPYLRAPPAALRAQELCRDGQPDRAAGAFRPGWPIRRAPVLERRQGVERPRAALGSRMPLRAGGGGPARGAGELRGARPQAGRVVGGLRDAWGAKVAKLRHAAEVPAARTGGAAARRASLVCAPGTRLRSPYSTTVCDWSSSGRRWRCAMALRARRGSEPASGWSGPPR